MGSTGSSWSTCLVVSAGEWDRRFSTEAAGELRLFVLLVFSKVELAREEVELKVFLLWPMLLLLLTLLLAVVVIVGAPLEPLIPLELLIPQEPLLVMTLPFVSGLLLLVFPASNWLLRALTEGRNFLTLAGLDSVSLLLLLLVAVPPVLLQFLMSTWEKGRRICGHDGVNSS